MATRLYPNTQDVAVLERLVNVPPGTHAKLKALEAKHKEAKDAALEGERYELGYQQYCEIHDDEAMGTLDAFITFGWGRVASPLCKVGEPDYSGKIDFPDWRVQQILKDQGIKNIDQLNGVSLEEMGGVHWC